MKCTAYIDGQVYCKAESVNELIWNLGAKYGAREYNTLIKQGRIHINEDSVKVFMTLTPPEREYLFNFFGGGWNSIMALNELDAIEKIKSKYEDDTICVPDLDTVRLSTEADYNYHMSQFN